MGYNNCVPFASSSIHLDFNKTERNIFDIEFLAKNCEASMKVYTNNYYQTKAASLFRLYEINDEDKLTERIEYPLEKNMVNIDDVKKQIMILLNPSLMIRLRNS